MFIVHIVSNPLSEEQCSLKSVYSMMPVIQINFFLYQTEAGKIECGNRKERGREREREREKYETERR